MFTFRFSTFNILFANKKKKSFNSFSIIVTRIINHNVVVGPVIV